MKSMAVGSGGSFGQAAHEGHHFLETALLQPWLAHDRRAKPQDDGGAGLLGGLSHLERVLIPTLEITDCVAAQPGSFQNLGHLDDRHG